jgi:hypothetical protein
MAGKSPAARTIWKAVIQATLAAGAAAATQAASSPSTNSYSFTASLALKESADSNVYLQSTTPLANQESMVTSVLPQAGFSWKPQAAFNATVSYAPEFVSFHAEPDEDFALHRVGLTLGGALDQVTYECINTVVLIEGNDLSPTWTGAGGAPAAGGPAIRDRRDAAVFRNTSRVKWSAGEWMFRPGAAVYVHDFQTRQSLAPGYQNSVDRNEVQLGVDFGHSVGADLVGFAGYRFGIQDQAQLFQFPEEYDNKFHRFLLGAEGKWLKWLKANLSLGPEYREYAESVPAGFDRTEWNLFVDASLTVAPSQTDTITASIKQFEQPGFGGRSAYEDLTYDLGWRHRVDEKLIIGLGGRAYNTDFLDPVKRNDWVLSPHVLANYTFSKSLSAELSYVYEEGISRVPDTAGREYSRHVVAMGLKYVFR